MNKWSHIFAACLSLLTIASRADAVSNKNSSGTSLLLFGDSYFDTGAGNAVSEQYGVPLVAPTPTSVPPGPYFDGRRSNGPIWVDYTSAAMNLPVVNYAVGGSQTGVLNINQPPSPNPIGGLLQQLQRFASTGQKIKSNQLVIVDGAGNDILALVPSGLNVPAVQGAVTQALTNLGTQVLPGLQLLGADQILLWNLGDLSMLPLFNSAVFGPLDNPLVRQLMQGASEGFNEALIPIVQQLNSQIGHEAVGVKGSPQIFILDMKRVFDRVAARFLAEGIDLSLFPWIAQYGGPYVPNPLVPPGTDLATLAFFDQVHPTSRAWQIVAEEIIPKIDTINSATRFASAAVDLALETASGHRDLVDNHLRVLRERRYIFNNPCNACCDPCYCYNDPCSNDCCQDVCYESCNPCDRFNAYMSTEGKWGSTETRTGTFGLNFDTQLVLAGLDYRLRDNINIGASFTFQTSQSKLKEGRGSMDLNDYIPTVYSTYFGENFFIDLASSVHFYQFRKIKRNIAFFDGSARSHTHGCAAELNFDAGYVGTRNCLTYIPLIGLSFENLVISRFHEHGAGEWDLVSNRLYQRSLIGKIGGQLFYSLWNNTTVAFAELIYQHEFLRDKHPVSLRFADSVDNAVIRSKSSAVERESLKYSVGLDANFCGILGSLSYVGETNFKNYTNAVRLEIDYAF